MSSELLSINWWLACICNSQGIARTMSWWGNQEPRMTVTILPLLCLPLKGSGVQTPVRRQAFQWLSCLFGTGRANRKFSVAGLPAEQGLCNHYSTEKYLLELKSYDLKVTAGRSSVFLFLDQIPISKFSILSFSPLLNVQADMLIAWQHVATMFRIKIKLLSRFTLFLKCPKIHTEKLALTPKYFRL